MKEKIGFIGAGKVGCALGLHFMHHGRTVVGYYSRTLHHAKEAADAVHTNCYLKLGDIVRDSTVLFLTVPDDCISSVWEEVRAYPLAGKIICHTSGILSSSVLSGGQGVKVASVHMMCAIGTRFGDAEKLEGIPFSVEGSAEERMKDLLARCGNESVRISPKKKAEYHTAGVFSTNFLVGLLNEAETLLEGSGMSTEVARATVARAAVGVTRKWEACGAEAALSGPLERGDIQTIKTHFSVLSDAEKEFYMALCRAILPIAEGKNPARDYRKVKELFEDENNG